MIGETVNPQTDVEHIDGSPALELSPRKITSSADFTIFSGSRAVAETTNLVTQAAQPAARHFALKAERLADGQ